MMNLNRFTKRILITLLVTAGLCAAYFYAVIQPRYTVPIIMYHHVEPLDHHEANWINPANFENHLSFLRKNNYKILTLADLVDITKEGKSLPRNAVVLTFDDGYSDNYHNAFNILKKYSIPAIIFMPSSYIGKDGYLNVNQMKEMVESGLIAFGSHTVTHEYLPPLNDNDRRKEILESKKTIGSILGKPVDFLAYPIGGFSEDIKTLVKNAGYKAACATNRGYDKLNKDVYELKRIRFSNKDDSDFLLWWKLNGYYNLFRKSKNPY